MIYATVGLEQAAAQQALVAAGWEATTLTVSYTDAKDTKLKLFRKQIPDTDAGLARDTARVFYFTFDLDIGCFGGRYTYGKGFGFAGKKGLWLPYMDTLAINLQFKSSDNVGYELFQCPSTRCVKPPVATAANKLVANRASCYLAHGDVPAATFSKVGNCVCHAIYCQPDAAYKLPASIVLPNPRWVEYQKLHKAVPDGTAFDSKFTMIKLESSPHMFAIYASVRDGEVGRNKATGIANQDEFFPIVNPGGNYDERLPGVLTVTSSTAGGLANSYSILTLYELYKKNCKRLCPGRSCYSFTQWYSSKCIILLSPEDLGGNMPGQSVYSPQVLSISISHQIPAAYGAGTVQNDGSQGRVEIGANNTVPLTRLCLLYMDNVVISSGSASLSSTLVSASQVSGAVQPQEQQVGRALDKMQVAYQ